MYSVYPPSERPGALNLSVFVLAEKTGYPVQVEGSVEAEAL
jgi:hypothetical protein